MVFGSKRVRDREEEEREMSDPHSPDPRLLEDAGHPYSETCEASKLAAQERAAILASGIEFVRTRILPQYEREREERDHATRVPEGATPSPWFG